MTLKLTPSETRAVNIGNALVAGKNATATIDKECQAERKARKGKDVGLLSSGDGFMVRINEILIKAGWKEQTIKNALTTVRKAVNKGDKFSLNPYRDASKKGSQAGKTVATTGVKFKGDAKLDDIVKGLRTMFNKFKENDKTMSLASYLIDALNDFEGDSK
jgi:hypothetical protein